MFDEVNLYGVFQTKPLLLVDRHNQSEVVLINKLMRNTKKTKQLLISIMWLRDIYFFVDVSNSLETSLEKFSFVYFGWHC